MVCDHCGKPFESGFLIGALHLGAVASCGTCFNEVRFEPDESPALCPSCIKKELARVVDQAQGAYTGHVQAVEARAAGFTVTG